MFVTGGALALTGWLVIYATDAAKAISKAADRIPAGARIVGGADPVY